MKEKALQSFTTFNTEHFFLEVQGKGPDTFLWGHGWGQSHGAFLPLVQSLTSLGNHNVIDFPGFGQSPKPANDWTTEQYADAIAEYIKDPVIWAGHSFGGRVGIRLASKYPDKVKALIIIAGAGLKRKRSPSKKLYFKLRIMLYKALRKLTPVFISEEWLRAKFGSSDYNSAGDMRGIFRNVIAEDLTPNAKDIACPTLLIYGENDTETPPEFGERFSKLMKQTELHILSGQDHYSVLSSGRHQVASLIQNFVKKLDAT